MERAEDTKEKRKKGKTRMTEKKGRGRQPRDPKNKTKFFKTSIR